jgi:actin-related protein
MDKLTVAVSWRRGEDKINYFDIEFPKNQELLSVKEATMILAAGMSMLIKAGHKNGDIKDYEMMEHVIDYMKSEFVSTESFEDATIQPNTLKSEL